MKNHVIWQSKTPHEELGRHEIKIQEAFEDITSSGNSIPSRKASLEEETLKKTTKKKEGKNALEAEVTRPECAATHPAVQNNAEKQCF